MTTQVRMAVADLRAGGGEEVLEAAKAGHPHGRYVHPDRLTELASLTASETLPTSVQVDFSPDLDVLIGEIVRILK